MEKTVNGVTMKYHFVDSKVIYNSYYTYDSNNKLVGMELNEVEY
jgi:hypothetical protein